MAAFDIQWCSSTCVEFTGGLCSFCFGNCGVYGKSMDWFASCFISPFAVIIDYPSRRTNEILTESMKTEAGWIGRRIIEEKLSINAASGTILKILMRRLT